MGRPIHLPIIQLDRPGNYPCIVSVLPPLTLMVAVAVASDFSSLVCASTCVRISVMLVSRTIPPMHISWRILCTYTNKCHLVNKWCKRRRRRGGLYLVNMKYQIQLTHILKAAIQGLHKDLLVMCVGVWMDSRWGRGVTHMYSMSKNITCLLPLALPWYYTHT